MCYVSAPRISGAPDGKRAPQSRFVCCGARVEALFETGTKAQFSIFGISAEMAGMYPKLTTRAQYLYNRTSAICGAGDPVPCKSFVTVGLACYNAISLRAYQDKVE